MSYFRLLLCLSPLAGFLLLTPAGRGTSIARLSLEETIVRADAIVDGDVVRNWCGWDSAHRFIWTHTEIAVRDRWKGVSGPTVTVSEPGGEAEGVGMAIAGMVRYTPGERVVVFLYRTPIGYMRTVGLAQGKLQVDSRGVVHPSMADALLVSPAGARPAGSSIAELDAGSLSAVRDRITRMAAALKGVRK